MPVDWPALSRRYALDGESERPWWRRVEDGWTRRDGWTLNGNVGEPPTAFAREVLGPWYTTTADVVAKLDAFDREHPLPAPEPACGQVWVWPGGAERMIVAIDEWPVWGGRGVSWGGHRECPPPGAVTVAGPGSPWANTREG